MAFTTPAYSKSRVNWAGDLMARGLSSERLLDLSFDDLEEAERIATNWRASHAYPINTFQATLRNKLRAIEERALVAQRLKRMPSILSKLRRFKGMKLARMQDIGGLRAVVSSMARLRRLVTAYDHAKFAHEFVSMSDYIDQPKDDGYRSLHLVYRYSNDRAPAYKGLLIELQIRTRLQHAWATAVETMGTFLGQALKSGQGDLAWREFFRVSGAALALLEKSNPVPGFEMLSRKETFQAVASAERELRVLDRLRGFSIAADKITTERGQGAYHLVILDSFTKSVIIRPYTKARLEVANADYAEFEKRAAAGEKIETVLVSAGPIEALRRAYPNYFLDTNEFIGQIERVIAET